MKGSETAVKEEKPVRGKLLVVEEARAYIRMSKTVFHECLNNGSIPCFRPPRGKILVDSADLDDWLRNSKGT